LETGLKYGRIVGHDLQWREGEYGFVNGRYYGERSEYNWIAVVLE